MYARATLSIMAVILAFSAASSSPSIAATRRCGPAVVSEIAVAASEPQGKRKALLSWSQRAARLGPDFTNWRLADRKVLGCRAAKAPQSGFQCVAYASPCTIVQSAPGPAPKGRAPAPRKATIET